MAFPSPSLRDILPPPRTLACALAAMLSLAAISPTAAQGTRGTRLYLQPYRGTRAYAGTDELAYRVIQADKTLALIELNPPPGVMQVTFRLDGYADTVFYTFPAQDHDAGREPDAGALPLVVLRRQGSRYAFERAVATGSQPKSVTFIDKRRVAVALLDGPGIDIIDIVSGKRERIAPPEPWARKLGFVECLVIPGRCELWVSQMTAGAAHVFRLPGLEYRGTVKSGGVWGKVLAYNKAENRIYMTNWVSEDVSVIDPDTLREERRLRFSAVPRGIAFSGEGRAMYLAQYEIDGEPRGRLLKVDLATGVLLASMGVEGSKRHLVIDESRSRLYVSDMARDLIEVFSLKDDSFIGSVSVGAKPNTIALSPDGSILYVSCRGHNNPDKGYLYKGYDMGRVYVIDTFSLSVREWWEGGNQPTGLAVSPDGALVVSSDFLDARVRIHRKLEPKAKGQPAAEPL